MGKSDSLLIRDMGFDDCDDVAQLEQTLGATSWGLALFRGEFEMDQSRRTWFVAEVGGTIVAFAGISHVLREANVLNIGVAKQYQSQGLGSTLVTRLLEVAISNECQQIWLEVETTNSNAILLYKKFGFDSINVRKDYYGKGRDLSLIHI